MLSDKSISWRLEQPKKALSPSCLTFSGTYTYVIAVREKAFLWIP